MLLTLSPLYSPEGFRARLACLIHTANVRSEPGSNPSVECLILGWELAITHLEPSVRGECTARPNSRVVSKATLFVKEPLADLDPTTFPKGMIVRAVERGSCRAPTSS